MSRAISAVHIILTISVLAAGLSGCVAADNVSNSTKDERIGGKGAKIVYKKLTTNMMVKDVNRSIDFYSNVLGFEFVMGVPESSQEIVSKWQKDQHLAFAIMKHGDVEMMFQSRKSATEEISEFDNMDIGGSLIFYIEVEDVKKLYEKLKDEATIVRDMEAKFYGKQEFYIRDCNGYILGFAGDI